MRKNSFLSKEELLLQCNTIKRRQQRIIQVRQQSKQMSATILERVKREAQKQCEEIENQVLSEIRSYHQKELESSRKQYEKCISEINQRHYLQQINDNYCNKPITSNRRVQNLSPTKNVMKTNKDKQEIDISNEKSTRKSSEKVVSALKNPSKKTAERQVKVLTPPEVPPNVVIDSDDENVRKCTLLNFRPHTPNVKHVRSLQITENEKRCRHKKKPPCLNALRSKVLHSSTTDNLAVAGDKKPIEEMYNHLVHDRIRILEQKDKILDRQTMLLPNSVLFANKAPRFSEYFARFHSDKVSSRNAAQADTFRSDSDVNELMHDIKRIEMKKKLLKHELSKSGSNNHTKSISSSDGKSNDKKEISSSSSRNDVSNSSSDKKSRILNTDSSSKIAPRSKLCPSPIPKASSNDTYRESDRKPKSPRHRHYKRKMRSSKDVLVTVSNDKSVTASVIDTTAPARHDGMSSSNSTHNASESKGKAPVRVVVNVPPSTDCKIEIKNNADKKYVQSAGTQNVEKVKNWRHLFKNQEKLTESSYYSPPEHGKKVTVTSSEEYDAEEQSIPVSNAFTKDIGYYVRKLLLMSPESIDNLDISSCNTTLIDDSRTTSVDSNSTELAHRSNDKTTEFVEPPIVAENPQISENRCDDSENVRQLLLKCLRLATAETNNINLSSFKSTNSSYDYKSFGNLPAREFNTSDVSYTNFINAAIKRLLPLYQNSLDDNLDYSMQSTTTDVQNVKLTDDVCEIDTSKEDSAGISTSAYLQKFVSSLSPASEKRNKHTNEHLVEYLKKYLEQECWAEKQANCEDVQDSEAEHVSIQPTDVPSKDDSYISLPSVDELIQKGLISKSYVSTETQQKPKEFLLDEEQFIKKMLQIDFLSKESQHKDDPTRKAECNEELPLEPQSEEKFTPSTTEIRRELRRLGLNWMDTTLQRTLQASVINSTSSAEDSAGQLRCSRSASTKRPTSATNFVAMEQSCESREFLDISPITVPDLQLSVPECFKKT